MTRLSRRAALLGGLCAALGGPGVRAEAGGGAGPVLVVSRERVLRETRAGRALRQAERELTAAFQARVDAVKREIDAEEAELAQIRGQLTRAEFEARAQRFDAKVRITRRRSQRRAAELQRAVRLARERLTAELGPILIELLRAEGASIVLDADQILVAAPGVNKTDRVIALFDARVEPPEIRLPEAVPLRPSEAELDAMGAEPALPD